MTFTIRTQGHRTYTGTGYWQVSVGPHILIGRPCRDLWRAKQRAENYINSGKAMDRAKKIIG